MSLNLSKLNIFKEYPDKIIAQCPACAEEGRDTTGNHLAIFNNGSFTCIIYSGEEGEEHRKRIFELAGKVDTTFSYNDNSTKSNFSINPAIKNKSSVLIHNIFETLTLTQNKEKNILISNNATPNVPNETSLGQNDTSSNPYNHYLQDDLGHLGQFFTTPDSILQNTSYPSYSKKLNKHYRKENNNFIFDDGTIYNKEEFPFIKNMKKESLQKVDLVKGLFKGKIIKEE